MSILSVIIHDVYQARAAVTQANAIGAQVELRSPPDGATILGPGVFKAIADDLTHTYPVAAPVMILDCGTNAGMAMAALRQGCKDLCVNVPAKTHSKIAAIAQAQSARLHGPVDNALDLAAATDSRKLITQFRTKALLEQFLRGRALDE